MKIIIEEVVNIKKLRVGVIDSGKGGEYVGTKIKEIINCEVVQWKPPYFMSYSNMTMDDLINRCDIHTEFLKENKVDLVVIGCMTLSTNLRRYIKNNMGTIPVYDLYTNLPELNSTTLVIGTTNTINSNAFKGCVTLPVPNVSSAIEGGFDSLVPGYLRGYEASIKYLPEFSAVVLGCSHYSICKDIIAEHYRPAVIIDPVDYLIEQLKKDYVKEVNVDTIVNRV
jgi:glutamate racemase